jgi:hypothetical protein
VPRAREKLHALQDAQPLFELSPDWLEVPDPPETEQVQYTDLLETQDAAIDAACYDSLIL